MKAAGEGVLAMSCTRTARLAGVDKGEAIL